MTFCTSRGFDHAAHIDPGSTIERVYFVVPGFYGPEDASGQHPTWRAALAAGIAANEAAAQRYADAGRPGHDPGVVVDVRWLIRKPEGVFPGGSQDVVAQRHTYATVGDARDHLNHLDNLRRLTEGMPV